MKTQSLALAPHAHVVNVDERACKILDICFRRWRTWWILDGSTEEGDGGISGEFVSDGEAGLLESWCSGPEVRLDKGL